MKNGQSYIARHDLKTSAVFEPDLFIVFSDLHKQKFISKQKKDKIKVELHTHRSSREEKRSVYQRDLGTDQRKAEMPLVMLWFHVEAQCGGGGRVQT